MIETFICMWLFYGTTQRNGTPTFKFFFIPYPLRKFLGRYHKGNELYRTGVSQRSILKNRGRNRG